jgi:hypothetical protein
MALNSLADKIRNERPRGEIALLDPSPIGDVDPIIVSAPCHEIYQRYMSCEPPADRLVSHILIMDAPSKYAQEFYNAVDDVSSNTLRRGESIPPKIFLLPIPDHLNKRMKGRCY